MESKPCSELIFRLGRTGSFTILSGSLGEVMSLMMCWGTSVGMTTLPLPLALSLSVTMTLSLIIRINPIRDLSEWRWTVLIISKCRFNPREVTHIPRFVLAVRFWAITVDQAVPGHGMRWWTVWVCWVIVWSGSCSASGARGRVTTVDGVVSRVGECRGGRDIWRRV